MPCTQHNCRTCPYSMSTNTEDAGDLVVLGLDYDDWFCNHQDFKDKPKEIVSWVTQEETIPTPDWCPLMKKETIPQPTHKTYGERQAALREAWGPTKWEDIQPGKIYHLPPVGNEKRQDILVISKTDYILRVKKLNENNPNIGYITTIYKSTDNYYKFLIEHKILDFNQYIDDENLKETTTTCSYYPSIQ